jgi:7-carboxy-7-deazaguanine synthase
MREHSHLTLMSADPYHDKRNRIMVSEVFGKTVQGEGMLAGKPTVFVRTGGCDMRCSWCDSQHAVLPEYRHTWRMLPAQEVFDEVRRLSPEPILVTLSGGNPALQDGLEALIDLGHADGYTFAIETQGSVYKPWFSELDYITLSPKPPSSGMVRDDLALLRDTTLHACVLVADGHPRIKLCLKVVVFDNADYRYAREIALRYPGVPFYLQPGNATPPQAGPFDMKLVLQRYEWLINKALEDGWHGVTILPQIHSLLWGNKQGV